MKNIRYSKSGPAVLAGVFLFLFGFYPYLNLYALQATEGDTLVANAPKQIRARPVEPGRINIDGKLSEKIWQTADFTTGFTQREPDEGAPASEKTEVAFFYDNDALYIGARMYSSNPSEIQASVSRRDNQGNSQRLVISLDTYLDRRTSQSFAITASGVRADYFQPNDEMNFRGRDYTVDPVWSARSSIDSLGWTTEMRIPFSQLRFNNREEQVWGININRFIPRKNEDSFWIMVPQDATGWASRFGLLVGIKNVVPPRRLEFLPYVAGNALLTNPRQQNPFQDKLNLNGRLGGNVEYGLGPNLTLNATVNPDFGQVEIDPARVNLTAFETVFEEKRPFFTEGQQIFNVLGGGRRIEEKYFFSRRIGASPSLNPRADFVDSEQNTSILGASKITGRLPSGLSVGGVTAVTAREKARTFDLQSDQFDEVEVEPLTNYNAVRMQQEFGPHASTAGFILTGVYRDLREGTILRNRLHRSAVTGGTDWNLRFDEGKYRITGDAGFSYVSGEPEAILRTQRASAHYFQRPDASHVSLDTTKTSLSGYRASLGVSKNAGRHWLWDVSGSTRSPGFELNDVGILFRADEVSSRGELTYRENTPGDWYQSYRIEANSSFKWNYGGVRTENEFGIQGRIEWKNFWSTFVNMEWMPRSMNDRMTRGGPLMKSPDKKEIRVGLFTDRSATVFAETFTNYTTDELGGYNLSINGGIQFRPGGRFEYQLNPRFSLRTDKRQYITTLSGGPAETFGKRYVFSTIDRSTLSLQMRVNYAFNPDLTLELFAEPFVSTGSFHDPGQLPSAGALKLDRYDVVGETADGNFLVNDGTGQFEVPDPDFLITSFRSNLVLRYQWRKGSTFFLVWQADLSDREDLDRLFRAGDLVDALGAGGNNILALKFTYWFSAD